MKAPDTTAATLATLELLLTEAKKDFSEHLSSDSRSEFESGRLAGRVQVLEHLLFTLR